MCVVYSECEWAKAGLDHRAFARKISNFRDGTANDLRKMQFLWLYSRYPGKYISAMWHLTNRKLFATNTPWGIPNPNPTPTDINLPQIRVVSASYVDKNTCRLCSVYVNCDRCLPAIFVMGCLWMFNFSTCGSVYDTSLMLYLFSSYVCIQALSNKDSRFALHASCDSIWLPI